jgi:hypothetical protein
VERKIPLDADHSMMVKFKSRSDDGYTDAVNFLLEFVKEAPAVVANRFSRWLRT